MFCREGKAEDDQGKDQFHGSSPTGNSRVVTTQFITTRHAFIVSGAVRIRTAGARAARDPISSRSKTPAAGSRRARFFQLAYPASVCFLFRTLWMLSALS